MKQQRNNSSPRLLIWALALGIASASWAGEKKCPFAGSPEAPARIPLVTRDNAAPVPAAGVSAAGTTTTADQIATPSEDTTDILTMKQRYGHDPTGVRARLGMCRKGRYGHGKGRHRHFRGGNRWKTE
jgi:hypothetical protein